MLRKILYTATEELDNYFSIIDGYIFDEQEIVQMLKNKVIMIILKIIVMIRIMNNLNKMLKKS